MRLIISIITFILGILSVINAEVFNIGFNLDIDEPYDPFHNANEFIGDKRLLLSSSYKSSTDKSKGLQEFTPISNQIGQSEIQYYSFSVNTSTGLGEYYEYLIFLTGNICSQPDYLTVDDPSLTVYYSFNSSMFSNFELGEMSQFKNGYFQALERVPISSDDIDSVLYIAVRAPESTNTSDVWKYEIGVSQNDLVFQWDDRSWASLVDTDEDSALIVTGNLTGDHLTNYSSLNATKSKYSLFIYSYDYKDFFKQLNSSWCAVRNGPALLSTSYFESSFTNRGGGLQQQFFVPGLNSSTKYIAYLVSDFMGTSFGGAVYQPFEFETLGTDVCELIYDLDFCDQVAYSVPNSENLSNEAVKELYDNRAKSLFSNFSKALQQIACNTTDNAKYSPIRTCSDCHDSYKNWLCSVTIPRCSTRNITGYKYREVGKSRNNFINDVIQPQNAYYEILPCVNVCHAMVRDCPADFEFQCPKKDNDTISLSYYWDDGGKYATCNYVGNTLSNTSNAIKNFFINWGLLVSVVLVSIFM